MKENPPDYKFGPLPDKWIQEGVKPFPYIYCYQAFDKRVIDEVKAAYLAAGLNSQWESAWAKLQSLPPREFGRLRNAAIYTDTETTKVSSY